MSGVVGVEHRVERGAITLHAWEKYRDTPLGKPLAVLAHGSSTAGRESFDLQVSGKPSYSLMDFLAGEGFDVFAPDVRGFGRSTRPARGVTTAEACEDLESVVDHVLELRGASSVNLVAWSWGTQYGGMFAVAHPEKTARYVSYGQMHADSPDLARRRARIELFRSSPYLRIPAPAWRERFYSMTPVEATDPEVVDSYASAASRGEGRVPSGPQLDMVTMMPMVDPTLLRVPTLIIHGQHDDVADVGGLLPFFRQLPNPSRRYVVIPGAGHMMHLQRNHELFQNAVAEFLRTPG